MKLHSIYIITNKINGKKYIGQSVDPARRKASHFCATARGLIGKAILKYGRESFGFRVLMTGATKAEADYFEKAMIARMNTRVPHGYNLSAGGESGAFGHIKTPAHCQKLSISIKASCAKHEVKARRSKAQLLRFSDPETRRKQAIYAQHACDSRPPISDETREKLKTSLKIRWSDKAFKNKMRKAMKKVHSNKQFLVARGAAIKAGFAVRKKILSLPAGQGGMLAHAE